MSHITNLQAASHYSDLGMSPHTLRPLWASVQALYLELGTSTVAGGFGLPGLMAVPAMEGGVFLNHFFIMCVCLL